MADRYLLESSATDGYLLEDGSGVLLLETSAATVPFVSTLGIVPRVEPSHRIQGGYSTVPNLLITTLALFAAASTQRAPVEFRPQQVAGVQVFQPPNLLTSTLSGVPIPPGKQRTESAPQSRQNAQVWDRGTNILTIPVAFVAPVGLQQTTSAPGTPQPPDVEPPQNLAILVSQVVPVPPGRQQTDSAPSIARVLLWDRGSNTLLLTTPPAGQQQTRSAPSVVQSQVSPSSLNLSLLVSPIPPGQQRFDSAPVAAARQNVDQPPNVLAQFPPPVAETLPIGRQQTESAPPTPRIGDIKFARGLDPGPPVSTPAPPGQQRTESAPYAPPRLNIDQPANLLGSAIGLQPISSAQSEFLPTIGPTAVFLWLPPNTTINLPAVANPLPIGAQQTASAPSVSRVLLWDRGSNTLLLPTPPAGRQQTASAPLPTVVRVDQPPNLVLYAPAIPIPPGQQRTESAPILPPQVQSYEAPNTTLRIPLPGALPIGAQWTTSIPAQLTAVWSQNWTIPPDLLPPPVVVPEPPKVEQTPAGRSHKRRERYIARYRGEDYVFATNDELEAFVAWAVEREKPKPKKLRKPVKIRLTPDFQEEIAPITEIPETIYQLPASKALEQIRKLESRLVDEEDDAEWLILIT